MRKVLALCVVTLLLLASCNQRQHADLLLTNGKIYTVDSAFNVCEAVAVSNGKIVATGTTSQMLSQFSADETIDLRGKFVYPGFIDAHCHFYGYAMDLDKINLWGSSSFEAILDTLQANRSRLFGGWLFGRGWDQNDWQVKEFPTNEKLNEQFPDVPVILLRVDGHALLCNQKALEMCGVSAASKVTGGEVVVKNGRLTGLLVDNAMELVRKHIPDPDRGTQSSLLLRAATDCYEHGLTTVCDAGLMYSQVDLLDSLQQAGSLMLRTHVMLSDSGPNYERAFRDGPYKTPFMHVRSFKFYFDGALGSRGACLKQPYSDKPGQYGFLLGAYTYFLERARQMKQHGFQLNAHCIGDSAAALLFQLAGEVLDGENDLRWRMEHAQVVDSNDFPLFAKYSIVPSVQSTHATSDMYWAGSRLGDKRLKHAYAYRDLRQSARGRLALGTDFPVEKISPILTFYAAVFRKDAKGFPEGGFQSENALSREETLRAMTSGAAYACFEEHEKGSIEKGKLADFTILNTDLMAADERQVLKAKVMMTIIGGKVVYKKQ